MCMRLVVIVVFALWRERLHRVVVIVVEVDRLRAVDDGRDHPKEGACCPGIDIRRRDDGLRGGVDLDEHVVAECVRCRIRNDEIPVRERRHANRRGEWRPLKNGRDHRGTKRTARCGVRIRRRCRRAVDANHAIGIGIDDVEGIARLIVGEARGCEDISRRAVVVAKSKRFGSSQNISRMVRWFISI